MISIKEQTAKMLSEEFQISPEITSQLFERGILAEHICRNALIKKEYKQKAESKEKRRVRAKIGEQFNISVSLVEKIVLQQ